MFTVGSRYFKRLISARQDQSPSVPAEGGTTPIPVRIKVPVAPDEVGGNWDGGEPVKKEYCFPRGTSGIAFIISTSNNGTAPFVPLGSHLL